MQLSDYQKNKAKKTFEKNQTLEQLYMTADGFFFRDKNHANDQAANLKRNNKSDEVTIVRRAELMTPTAPPKGGDKKGSAGNGSAGLTKKGAEEPAGGDEKNTGAGSPETKEEINPDDYPDSEKKADYLAALETLIEVQGNLKSEMDERDNLPEDAHHMTKKAANKRVADLEEQVAACEEVAAEKRAALLAVQEPPQQ